ANGKHDPVAEVIVIFTRLLPLADEPGGEELFRAELAAGPVEQPGPAFGVIAEAEPGDRLIAEAAAVQVVAGGLCFGRLHEALVDLGFGPGEGFEKLVPAGRVAGLLTVLFRQLDAGPAGEQLERFGEADAGRLHQEREAVPPFLADPAAVRLPVGV